MYKLNKYAYKLQGEASLKKRAVYLAKLRKYNQIQVGGDVTEYPKVDGNVTAQYDELKRLRDVNANKVNKEDPTVERNVTAQHNELDRLRAEINALKVSNYKLSKANKTSLSLNTDLTQQFNQVKTNHEVNKQKLIKLQTDYDILQKELDLKIAAATKELEQHLDEQTALAKKALARNEELDAQIKRLTDELTPVYAAINILRENIDNALELLKTKLL